MDDREKSRRSSVDRRMDSDSRSESPQPRNIRNRRRSTPPKRDNRDDRRNRNFRREQERENPEESRCLGVFGMDKYTKEEDLQDVFGRYGPIEKIQMIRDRDTNLSRGFGFVYFESLKDAKVARDRCNGMEINEKAIRVDFSITQRAHSPTPGLYIGNRRRQYGDGRSDRRREGGSSRYYTGSRRDSYRRNERRHDSRYRSRSPRR